MQNGQMECSHNQEKTLKTFLKNCTHWKKIDSLNLLKKIKVSGYNQFIWATFK